ncbi:MAG: hypothetical protein ACP5T9_06370 [Thermoplasmata archaeon]
MKKSELIELKEEIFKELDLINTGRACIFVNLLANEYREDSLKSLLRSLKTVEKSLGKWALIEVLQDDKPGDKNE